MAKKEKIASVLPLSDRVLIKVEEREDSERKLASGIILPGTVKGDRDSAKRGEVIAVGAGRYDDGDLLPMSVKVGDTVLFSWGDQISIDDEDYYLVNETNVLAIVK